MNNTRTPCPDTLHPVFGRLNAAGTVDVLDVETGEAITRLDANVYPVGSQLSARYNHAEGITLTVDDAERIGLEVERPSPATLETLWCHGCGAETEAGRATAAGWVLPSHDDWYCGPCGPDSPATLAARALRAIPSTARTAQSRANGAKGGRPVQTHPDVRYTTYGGASYLVELDGDVLVWDTVADHYTRCHSIAPGLAGRIRARARGPEGTTKGRRP